MKRFIQWQAIMDHLRSLPVENKGELRMTRTTHSTVF